MPLNARLSVKYKEFIAVSEQLVYSHTHKLAIRECTQTII